MYAKSVTDFGQIVHNKIKVMDEKDKLTNKALREINAV